MRILGPMLIACVAVDPALPADDQPRSVDIDTAMEIARGPVAPAGFFNILDVTIRPVDFSAGYPLEDGTIFEIGAAEVAEEWETFQHGWDVYRLWANVDDEFAIVGGVGGSVDNNIDLIIDPSCGLFFNDPTFDQDTPQNPAIASAFPTAVFDTWVTIGSASRNSGILITEPNGEFGGFTGPIFCQNCGWTTTPSVGNGVVPGGYTGWRVLLGQFTVPKDSNIWGKVLVAGGGQVTIETFATFPFANGNTCGETCPWDCSPPFEPGEGKGNDVVNIDDLIRVIQAVSTQDLDCDVWPDHNNGVFGNDIVDLEDILATVDNFGPCPE